MAHFFCNGECGGVSDTPGTCGAETCSLYKEPLIECSCGDPENHKHEEGRTEESTHE
mgnify:CR=1 FL=1